MFWPHLASYEGRGRRGFTLIELLVVIGVITILAALLMPAIFTGLRSAETSACLSNLRQMAQSNVSYQKDFDQWMVCGGNKSSLHPTDNMNQEKPYEDPWDKSFAFPYWYEALQPYINSAASMAHAVDSYKARKGSTLNPGNKLQREVLRTEVAYLCGIYTCPTKKQALIGYGYNYVAPFGNAACYPNPKCPDFVWYDSKYKAYDYPINHRKHRVPIPILWYAKNVHASVLTVPSKQIALCDAGKVTNDENLDTDPAQWVENTNSNADGYVRFPLHSNYVNTNHYKKNHAWRPVPRHRGKTVCAMFDASASAIQIRDIVGYQWAEDGCLYDNVPPHKPPVPPRQE